MLKAMIQEGLVQRCFSATASQPDSPFLSGSARIGSPFLNGLHAASSLASSQASHLASSQAHSPDVLLKREDYPNVKFWYRRDWLNQVKDGGSSTDVGMESVRGKTLMSKGINKNAKYIEDANGESVDGWRLRDIRAHARAIWASFQTVSCAPSTWGRANMEVAYAFRREMRTKFPEFAFCENDWKADQLATDHYPSWYSNHIKGIQIKEEPNSALLVGSKRSSPTEPAVQSKKIKKVAVHIPLHVQLLIYFQNPWVMNPALNTVTEDSAPLSPIVLPNSSISMTTTTSTQGTLGAAEEISSASSAVTGPVDNASSTNSQVRAGPRAQPKKARKVLYIFYMYTRLIF